MTDEQYKHAIHIAGLIRKYNDQELNDEEYNELMAWKNASRAKMQIFEELSNAEDIADRLKVFLDNERKAAAWEQVMAEIEREKPPVVRTGVSRIKIVRYVAAASLLGIISFGAWRGLRRHAEDKGLRATAPIVANDLKPGSSRATLTLSDGSHIDLDGSKIGHLATQGTISLVKIDEETVSYTAAEAREPVKAGELAMNTLSTPRAGTFVVELPDHSKVWLNSGSTLRYPVSFKGQDRRVVELEGEAFFDISKDETHPFNVKVRDRVVEVLGTSFNIQSYADERSMQTTLVTGAVKVSAKGQSRTLKPGQQAEVDNAEGGKGIKVVMLDDLRRATAWKDGLFYFHDDDIQSVMRQLARWYDVGVEYEGKITADRFSGMIRRDKLASDVLKVLALSDVHFRIDGKKIVVMP